MVALGAGIGALSILLGPREKEHGRQKREAIEREKKEWEEYLDNPDDPGDDWGEPEPGDREGYDQPHNIPDGPNAL